MNKFISAVNVFQIYPNFICNYYWLISALMSCLYYRFNDNKISTKNLF